MYSVVLATMLAAGGQTADTWRHGCHGCWGGYSCHGCWGGGCWGGGYSCYGCYGGYSCYGCSGCYGCYGGYSCYGCSGCYGCYGGYSCYGCYGCSGCYGCYGGCYGYYSSHVDPVVVYGYANGGRDFITNGGYNGYYNGYAGGVIVQQAPAVAVAPAGAAPNPAITPANDAETDAVRRLLKSLREEKEIRKDTKSTSATANVARVTVRLPATAKLWVDGVYCPLTSDVRSFNTPALQPGKNYNYTLRVQYDDNGQMREESRRVALAAGRNVDVNFTTPVSTVQR